MSLRLLAAQLVVVVAKLSPGVVAFAKNTLLMKLSKSEESFKQRLQKPPCVATEEELQNS